MKRAPILLLFLIAASCATAPPAAQGPVHVVIVGTTDVHGWFNGHHDTPAYGGLPIFAAYVNALRAANAGRVVLVDSGDLYQGTLESNLFEGEPVTLGYNALGYSAAAVGNHEFDYGPVGPDSVVRTPGQDPLGALKKNAQLAKWPFLSANLVEKATGQTPAWAQKSAIIAVDGARIGIIGLSTPDTPNVTTAANVETLDFTDPVAAATGEAQKLRAAGADAVIVIAHMGGKCSDMNDVNDTASCCPDEEAMRFLRGIPAGTIDAYFAGHTHLQMRHVINGVPAVQAPAYSHSFSTIDLWVDRGAHKVAKSEIRAHTMLCSEVYAGTETCDTRRAPKGAALMPRVFEGKTITPDARITTLLDPYMQKVNAKRMEPTGIRTTERIPRSYDFEAPLGDLLADALRDAAKADIGFVNSGSIRTDLPAGDLVYTNVFEVMPFDNFVGVVTMTGAQITEALRLFSSADRGVMQVSGIRYVKDMTRDPMDRVTSVTLANGQPLDPNATYRVAMPDFLAQGGDGLMPVLSKIPKDRFTLDESRTFRDIFIDTVRKWPQPVIVKTDGRLTVVGKPAPTGGSKAPSC
jgi:5'-nucleotidase